MVDSVSAAQARRIALAAQGFGRASAGTVGIRQLQSALSRLAVLQLDSVNVFERSHYLPLFARLGIYSKADLDRLVFSPTSDYVEYWAHEAALIPIDHWPLFRWRMQFWRDYYAIRPDAWMHTNDVHIAWVLDELRANGPLKASQIEDDSRKGKTGWWDWSDTKRALEYLFRVGDVVSAGRTRFERTYALPEQKLPSTVLNAQISETDAVRELIRKSAVAHGVGTIRDLADYYRIKQAPAKAAADDLVDAGELLLVSVPGWGPTYLHKDARIPRRIDTIALLSPFDPIVWERARAERVFGFHYRIEIYTPAEKRVFGYYTLPLLIDDQLVGRIDLKSDRQARVLRVQSAWREGERHVDLDRVVGLLGRIAAWQGLEGVEFAGGGNLSNELAAAWGVTFTL